MDYERFFERNPKVAGGEVVFAGTRITLRTILASLAEGDGFEELIRSFPGLTVDHLRAAISFAAASALEDQPIPSVPRVS